MKKIILSLLIVIFIFTMTGCSENKTTNKTAANSKEKSSYSLSDFTKEYEELGIDAQKTDVAYSMVGAKDGIKYIANSNDEAYGLEVYKFDQNSDAYKKAEKNQQLTLEDMDMSLNATVKNGYALILDESYPKHDEIIELFNKLR